MNHFRLLAAAALVTLVLPLSAAGAADEPLVVVNTDVTSYPQVRLVVAAPTQTGDQTLTGAAFQVTEGGHPRAVQVEALAPEQLEVALVIDTSGSMIGPPLRAAKDAAHSFLNRLPSSVPVSVIGFGASPTVAIANSSDRAATATAITKLSAGGETALYDALGAALSHLPARPGTRRVVALLSDGGDTASTASLEATANAFAAAGVPLFVVELRTSESNPAAFSRLTSASGGEVVQASDPAALAGAFESVATRLVRQYSVTYRSEGRGSTDVDVVLQSQGLRATARSHLDLPAASPLAGPQPSARSEPSTTASPMGSWALIAGGALCGAAMLILLLAFLGLRAPRAVGLSPARRTTRLADAADRAEALGNRVLGLRGGAANIGATLDAAGVEIRPGEFLVAVVAVDLIVCLAGWVLVAPLIGLLLAVIVPVVARTGLNFLAGRRRRRFSDQLAETLQMLSGSMRAGHGLAQGVDSVAREAESPTAEEFRRLTIETRLGRDFVEALQSVADRVGSDDLRWVVQAVEIQREVGGDLAEVLDIVAGTIRDRTRIRRQVSALSAEGRMSAWVLMILPFGMGGIMAMTNPSYLSPLIESGTGHILLAVAAALLVVGGLWLRRIVKPIF